MFNATRLDPEKASYLFDQDEIVQINKDLEEIEANPYNLEEECLDDDIINRAFELKLPESDSISITVDKDKISLKDNRDVLSKKYKDELSDIANEIKNQKGLSKLWVIEEIFDVQKNNNATEDDFFKEAVSDPVEEKDSFFNKIRIKDVVINFDRDTSVDTNYGDYFEERRKIKPKIIEIQDYNIQ